MLLNTLLLGDTRHSQHQNIVGHQQWLVHPRPADFDEA